jgi:RNA polymerase sigma-70 factor (ECF subfamily)
MPEDHSFHDLIGRVRAGDAKAAEELVRCYEPSIRLVVRRRLSAAGLRRVLESMDICQSVLGSFFVRVALGQYELDTPDHLRRLLVTMALNKVRNHVRKHHAVQGLSGVPEPVAADPSPSQVASQLDLLQEVRRRLTPEERDLADQRAADRSWADLAAERGETPDALRVRYRRGLVRVLRELGLEE